MDNETKTEHCHDCNGTGKFTLVTHFFEPMRVPCQYCEGKGRITIKKKDDDNG